MSDALQHHASPDGTSSVSRQYSSDQDYQGDDFQPVNSQAVLTNTASPTNNMSNTSIASSLNGSTAVPLFNQLQLMQQLANNLPPKQRQQYMMSMVNMLGRSQQPLGGALTVLQNNQGGLYATGITPIDALYIQTQSTDQHNQLITSQCGSKSREGDVAVAEPERRKATSW